MNKALFEMGVNTQAIYDATNKLVDNIIEFIKDILSGVNDGKRVRIKEPQDVASTDPIKWLYLADGEVYYRTTEWLDYKLSDGLTANEATNLAEDLTSGHYTIEGKEK